MVSPQKEHGYVGIANEIWDEIIRRNFTKRQKDILLFILRLSYGCGRKVALIPKQKDFSLCGIGENHVKDEIDFLIKCKVIGKGVEKGGYLFNKDYDYWQVTPVFKWDTERFKELIHINLKEAKKKTEKLPETGSFEADEDKEKTSQNGNFSEGEELPETGSFENENFPKKEVELPEKGSLGADETIQDKASEPSKKGLKKEVIKKEIYIHQFDEFWNLYPNKVGKKKAMEKFLKIAPKTDFEKMMLGTQKYIEYCRETKRYLKDGSTFMNQQTWEDFLEVEIQKTLNISNGPKKASEMTMEEYSVYLSEGIEIE